MIYYLLYVFSVENRNYPCFEIRRLNLDQVVLLGVSVELQRFQKEVSLGSVRNEVTRSFELFDLYFRSGQLHQLLGPPWKGTLILPQFCVLPAFVSCDLVSIWRRNDWPRDLTSFGLLIVLPVMPWV